MDVIMPQLGETVAEGTVTKWYKKGGDAGKADDVLFDVETDKVSTEIPAQATGVLAEILVDEGVTAKVGAKLAVIRESGSAPPRQEPGQSTTATAAAPINAPSGTTKAGVTAPVRRADGTEKLSPV